MNLVEMMKREPETLVEHGQRTIEEFVADLRRIQAQARQLDAKISDTLTALEGKQPGFEIKEWERIHVTIRKFIEAHGSPIPREELIAALLQIGVGAARKDARKQINISLDRIEQNRKHALKILNGKVGLRKWDPGKFS